MGARKAGIVACSGWWEAPPPGWGRARVYLEDITGKVISEIAGKIVSEAVGDIVSARRVTAR
jgi:hypothetical protein